MKTVLPGKKFLSEGPVATSSNARGVDWPRIRVVVASVAFIVILSEAPLVLFESQWGGAWAVPTAFVPIGMGITLFAMAKRTNWLLPVVRTAPAIGALFAWSLLSVFWSVSVATTTNAFIRYLLPAATCVAVAAVLDFAERIIVVTVGLGIGIFISAYLLATDNRIGRYEFDYLFNGAWVHRNLLGHAAALFISLVVAVVLIRPRVWPLTIPPLVTCVVVLVASNAKTAYIAIPAALFVVVVLGPALIVSQVVSDLTKRRRLSIIWGAVLGVGVILLFGFLLRASPSFRAEIWANRTLTRRTTYWKAAWPVIRPQISTGFGFGNTLIESSREDLIQQKMGYSLAHLHNGYLDRLAGGGVVSLIAIVMLIAQAMKRSWTRYRGSSASAGLAGMVLVATVVVLNVTEPDFLFTFIPTFFVLVSIALPGKSLRSVVASDDLQGGSVPSSGRVLVEGSLSYARLRRWILSGNPIVLTPREPLAGFVQQTGRKRMLAGTALAILSLGLLYLGPFFLSIGDRSRRVSGSCGRIPSELQKLASDVERVDQTSFPTISAVLRSLDSGQIIEPSEILTTMPPVGRNRGYDQVNVRSLRLTCGLVYSPAEASESVVLQLVSAKIDSNRYASQIAMLIRNLETRPDVIALLTASGGGRLAVQDVLNWAITLPSDDPSFSELAPQSEFYKELARSWTQPKHWWIRMLP